MIPVHPPAPRQHGLQPALRNPFVHERARRSSAILRSARVLQELIWLGGKKKPRNPPASAQQPRPPVLLPAPKRRRKGTRRCPTVPHIRQQLVARVAWQQQHRPHPSPRRYVDSLLHTPGRSHFALRPVFICRSEVRAQHAAVTLAFGTPKTGSMHCLAYLQRTCARKHLLLTLAQHLDTHKG